MKCFWTHITPPGGTYVRNLYQDFGKAPGFNPSGAQVSHIGFSISGVGTATFDDLKIGLAIPVTLPIITSQPQNATVTVGSNVTFAVSANGTAPLSFQWRKNGAPLSGGTAATLLPNNISTNHAGDYTVLVSNAAGSVPSQAATLMVTVPVSAPLIRSVVYIAVVFFSQALCRCRSVLKSISTLSASVAVNRQSSGRT